MKNKNLLDLKKNIKSQVLKNGIYTFKTFNFFNGDKNGKNYYDVDLFAKECGIVKNNKIYYCIYVYKNHFNLIYNKQFSKLDLALDFFEKMKGVCK